MTFHPFLDPALPSLHAQSGSSQHAHKAHRNITKATGVCSYAHHNILCGHKCTNTSLYSTDMKSIDSCVGNELVCMIHDVSMM